MQCACGKGGKNMPKQEARQHRKGRMTLKRREAATGWLFVSPALIGFSIFTFGAILRSFYFSLTDYSLLTEPEFLGLDNYIRAFTNDEYFYKYFRNTFYFVVTLVPIVLVCSLLLAILINRKAGRITKAYRVALFLPSITSTVAVSMVWLWIFNPDLGLLNNFLTAIGFQTPPMWLSDPQWSKPALVIMRVWQMCGYYMIMFLTGLQTIPETLYEAAEVDGASPVQLTPTKVSISTALSSAALPLRSVCSSMASFSWEPTVKTGFKLVMGSWKIMEQHFPRKSRICFSVNLVMSSPL